jgi:hypothetical protein
MPAPQYIGNTSWSRQPGATSGIDDGRAFYEIPYAGKLVDAPAFRVAWRRGTACPIVGWEHLFLLQGPTITEEEGGKCTATLRFEGPDINGEFGEDNDETVWYAERRSIELPLPAYQTDGVGTTYLFNAQIAVVTYSQDSRPTTVGRAPTLEDPEWVGIERGPVFPIPVASLVEGEDYKVTTSSALLEIVKTSDNSYNVREWHEKIFTAVEDGEA